MSRRLRVPLQPWLARAQSTTGRPALPSPLQRELFRRVAQPVAVITARIPPPGEHGRTGRDREDDEEEQAHNHGATLSSLASISLSPPLVSFSLRLPSRLAAFLSPPEGQQQSRLFRVHLLSTAQEPLARAFARQAPLPAKAQPSPPPRSTAPPPDAPAHVDSLSPTPHFDPALFAQLERTGLGALDCRVVRRIPLSTLGAGAQVGEVGADQPRSELFIAEVERVRLGEGGGGEEGETSLLYWDQQYAGVRALEPQDGTDRER